MLKFITQPIRNALTRAERKQTRYALQNAAETASDENGEITFEQMLTELENDARVNLEEADDNNNET